MTQRARFGFPADSYTPHGYLDNPLHSWRVSKSGVLRTTGAIGIAWHFPSYPGPYGRRWIYEASLEIETRDEGVLSADHHTKEMIRFRIADLAVEMFLDNDTIVALVNGPPGHEISAHGRYRRQLGLSGDWDFGLLARQDEGGAGHLAVFAEGTAFVLLAERAPVRFDVSSADEGWPDRSAPIEKSIVHHHRLDSAGRIAIVLARSESSSAALTHANAALTGFGRTRRRKLAADARFWRDAPRLAGDWPPHWRRGLVYDIETLRTIVRRPTGVYGGRWDGMQIQVPRVVLAETTLDMLLLSYADPATARAVVLSTFRDAIAPNVPCTREDGSVNMVEIGGAACGTSPAWCWPFWCIGLLFRRTADREWLIALLPHLEAFLDWWLTNRVQADGAPFYLCGWESGQDASPRFGARERGGGEITEIEPVDLDAALAQSARLLSSWLHELGKDGDRWIAVAERFERRTHALWHKGWFHDRVGDRATAVRDPMQLSPLFCHVASPEQIAALRPTFASLPPHGEYTPLEWPPVALTALESALQGGEADWAAASAADIVDRVWATTDAPRHEPGRPLPGVAHEHWSPSGEWHTEGYGWGASTVLFFLRYICGIRDEPDSDELRIEPRLPPYLMRSGATYQLLNLPWRGQMLDLSYIVDPAGRSVTVEKSWSRRYSGKR